MRRPGFLLLVLLIALPALPQSQPQPQQPAFFTESIDVRIINVDVVVTKDGRPANGLTSDDFELYENGKKQPIANFLEIHGDDRASSTAAAQAAAAPGATAPARPSDPRVRNVVVFFDATSIAPGSRERVLKPAGKFLHDALRPHDRVMILSWNPGLKVEQELTTDTAAAGTVLERLIRTTTTITGNGFDLRLAERELAAMKRDYQMVQELPPIATAISRADQFADKVLFEQAQKVEGVKSVIASMRGIPGRNALVLITSELSEQPALPIFEFLDSIKKDFADGSSYNPQAEAQRFDQRGMAREIADAANSNFVTLYPISGSGLGIEHDSLAADQLGQETVTPIRAVKHHDDALQTLQELAVRTGGAALTNSNNMSLAFDTLLSDLTTYYSLGYHAEGLQEDVVRTIEVKLKKKGYVVRSRQTFVEKSLTSEMNDAVASNLLYPIAKNDLNVTLASAGASTPAADHQLMVPVLIHIPTNTLTLVPDGADLVGQFSIYTAFIRADGRVSTVKRQQQNVRFPADSLKRRKEITVRWELAVDDKTSGVSLGILDDTSHASGFAALKIQ